MATEKVEDISRRGTRDRGTSGSREDPELDEARLVGTTNALCKQNESLRQTIALIDRLTAMTLAGENVAQITEAVATSLRQAVVVFNQARQPLAASNFDGNPDGPGDTDQQLARSHNPLVAGAEDPYLQQAFEAASSKHLPLRLPKLPGSSLEVECILTPVTIGEDLLGFLAVTTDRGAAGEDLDLLNVQHAASIFALALLQEHQETQLRARYRRELVEGLLLGQSSRARAAELAVLSGLIPDAPYWAFAVAPMVNVEGTVLDDSLLTSVANALDGREPGTLAVPRPEHVAIFVASLERPGSPGPPTLNEVGSDLSTFLSRRFPGQSFAIGASTIVASPIELGFAIEQAQRALAVIKHLGVSSEMMTYHDLGVHRLLLHVPEDDLRAFVSDVLGDLLAYDKAHGSSLVETLSTYLNENENLRRTASEMFLHVNTVNYRIRRIETISGLQLGDARQRLVAQVAVEILRLIESQ